MSAKSVVCLVGIGIAGLVIFSAVGFVVELVSSADAYGHALSAYKGQ